MADDLTHTSCFLVSSVPSRPFDREMLLNRLAGTSFMLCFDIRGRRTILIINGSSEEDNSKAAASISSSIAGLAFRAVEPPQLPEGGVEVMSLYRKVESIPQNFMADIFDSGIEDGLLFISFLAEHDARIKDAKEYLEGELNRIGVRENTSFVKGWVGSRYSKSVQREIFDRSEESELLGELINSMNQSLLSNNSAYRIFFFASSSPRLRGYLASKFIVFKSFEGKAGSLEDIFGMASSLRCIPFGSGFAMGLLCLGAGARVSHVVPTGSQVNSGGDIPLGTLLKDGAHDTSVRVCVARQSINLGFIISGLPGSGKTREAMSVVDSVMKAGNTKIIIISPTSEWNDFALSHGMHLVRACSDGIPINFFRCPAGSDVPSFYQGLAMIISAASGAGPYQNPMEKCMLNAFRRSYAGTAEPDPASVYYDIEDSIAAMHGKATPSGVRYTKHGENIKSSLENIVSILGRDEYSSRYGAKMEDLLEGGAVFDLSMAGVGEKQYMYAMLLNQVYSIGSTFDVHGDEELRMLICLEEAQMVFKEQSSAAVEDLKSRIQDFRKRGIGLLLLTHSVTDIDVGIRRLCQLKIYLKQAPDAAQVAARDHVFSAAKDDDIIAKLKSLDSRVGALNYVCREGSEKLSNDSVFIRTLQYDDVRHSGQSRSAFHKMDGFARPQSIQSSITIITGGSGQRAGGQTRYLLLRYLGSVVAERQVEAEQNSGAAEITIELKDGRQYEAELLDERRRIKRRMRLQASNKIYINE